MKFHNPVTIYKLANKLECLAPGRRVIGLKQSIQKFLLLAVVNSMDYYHRRRRRRGEKFITVTDSVYI
jgi:hypothetical protein